MSFAATWLALRAPADTAARDPHLLRLAATHFAAHTSPRVVDLGAGTGATVRALSPHAPPSTRWCLIDTDASLLAEAERTLHGEIETRVADLAHLDALPVDGAHLVTASALFDLMPAAWIERLADRLATAHLGLYAALSYNGELSWTPAHPDDAAITDAFNAHQRGDKGLGPALGPDAGAALADAFRARGFEVHTAPSPWRLGPREAALQQELVTGIGAAASEWGIPDSAAWAQARRAASGSAVCTVGHLDVLALPPASSAQSKITSVSSP